MPWDHLTKFLKNEILFSVYISLMKLLNAHTQSDNISPLAAEQYYVKS